MRISTARILLILLTGLLMLPVSTYAQTGSSAALGKPDSSAFPEITAYLDVRDAQGRFVRGLGVEEINIREGDLTLRASWVKELHPGAQFVTAINPGSSFAIRNSQAVSRYDYILAALTQWGASRQGSNIDDLSLLVTNGPEISHTPDPLQWMQALNSAPLEVRDAAPNLDTLFRAINLAADTPPRPGMRRAVLFITPPLDGDNAQPLENLTAQANSQQVAVFVWMVSSAGALATLSATQLINLAQNTEGEFLAYTGEEPLPSPENYLEARRYIYQLGYQSGIKTSGSIPLSVQINSADGVIETPPASLEVDIQPPQPVFVSPPLVILRRPVSDAQSDPREVPLSEYDPATQEMQIIIDFPDGRQRPLVRTSLLVDGELVVENNQAPFDSFTWQIARYTTDGSHILQVAAEDIYGLVGVSVETPVKITIQVIEPDPWAIVRRNMPILAGALVVVAGAVLVLVLILGGRLRPRVWGLKPGRSRKADPLTQPVDIPEEGAARRMPNWVNRLQWPHRQAAVEAYAFLSPISENDNLPTSAPIPILADETTFGSQPSQAAIVLQDHSVEALHARLIRQEDNSFRLCDEGSIAGTWVNYGPVSQNGARLEHGDLVHIGRVGFRFTLRLPTRVRKPVIIPEPGPPGDEMPTPDQPNPAPEIEP